MSTCTSSLPLSGGTPSRQGTQVLLARDDIESLLAYCSGLYRMRPGPHFQNSGKSHPEYTETFGSGTAFGWQGVQVGQPLGGAALFNTSIAVSFPRGP